MQRRKEDGMLKRGIISVAMSPTKSLARVRFSSATRLVVSVHGWHQEALLLYVRRLLLKHPPTKITMNYSFHCIALHAKRARRFFIEHFGESYISIMDNVKIHRRGSQQKYNPYEADSCFGKFFEGRWWSTTNTRWRIHQWPKEACVD